VLHNRTKHETCIKVASYSLYIALPDFGRDPQHPSKVAWARKVEHWHYGTVVHLKRRRSAAFTAKDKA
jgi:hypothetical protein